MTMYSKANLVVGAVASSNPLDRGMAGVRLEGDGSTVAGNGKVLVAVGPLGEVPFPDVGEQQEPGESGMVLKQDHVAEAVKNMPRDARLQHTAMTKARTGRKGTAEFTTVDPSGRERRVADDPLEHPYPDWKNVIRKARGEEPVKVCVNRKDLLEMLKTIEAACPDKGGDSPVFLEIGSGIVARSVNRMTNQHAIGVTAAYKTDGFWMEPDDWERGVLEKPASPVNNRVKRPKKKIRKRKVV